MNAITKLRRSFYLFTRNLQNGRTHLLLLLLVAAAMCLLIVMYRIRYGIHQRKPQEFASNVKFTEQLTQKSKPFEGHRLIHLDLKGAPPKISYLQKVFPLFRRWGATGLLIEYEDTFPYTGELELLKAPYAYSVEDIHLLLYEAKKYSLEVIPLVQTFGHLEFVLKHKQFASLRETEGYINALCPLNSKSLPLVTSMLDQIMALHKDIKYLHIGGDEVWNMKVCKACKSDPRDHSGLFLAHMLPVLKHVKSEGLKAIMWDDMMREWEIPALKDIGNLVQPMVWAYAADLYGFFNEGMWERYSEAFPEVWIASSFKGADKPYSQYVPVGQHVQNHQSWMKIIRDLPKSLKMKGIALTGWSRFDHSGTLCELLPAAIPSLVLCLGVLNYGEFNPEMHKVISENLGFKQKISLYAFRPRALPVSEGDFPGKEIYSIVNEIKQITSYIDYALTSEIGWLGEHQIKRGQNMFRIDEIHDSLSRSEKQLRRLKAEVNKPFLETFPEEIVNEWIHDFIEKTQEQIDGIRKEVNQTLAVPRV